MPEKANKKFAKIYDKHIDKIYRFVFIKTGSKETAEDLTSQVFAKGWRKFKIQGDDIQNVSAYLYQIARAEIANFYRDTAKFQIVSANAVEIQDVKSNFDGQDIKDFLKGMEDDLQNILIWHYVEGLAFREIGKLLDRPEGTVRVMAHRALKELREKM